MFKKRANFSNGLTNLISNEKIDLEHVIFHNDLSITLRNGAPVLLDFLFSSENYEKVIDYALFDKKSESPEFADFSIRQINNNSANILSYPNDKLKRRLYEIEGESGKPLLLEKFEEFIDEKSKYKRDDYYAGHFQRIFENVMTMEDFDIFFNDEFVDKLILFLSENVTILAYKGLLQLFLTDFIDKIDEETVKKIFKTIAQHATFFSYVTYCNQSTNQSKTIESYQKSIKIFKKKQPINNFNRAFPIPDFLKDKNAGKNLKINASNAKSKGEKFFPPKYKSKNPKSINSEEAQEKSFLFLSIIGTSLLESNKIEFFDESIIEMILYCAVFSDAESLASAEAFKILRILYYGVHVYNDLSNDVWFNPLESEMFYKLIDKYAALFNFDIKNLNKQQINAFSIFWNHRYENLTDDEILLVNIDPVLNMKDCHFFPNQLTPFLYFRPLLLLDPPISNDLNMHYIRIFDFLCKKKEKLMGEMKKDLKSYDTKIQDEVRKIVFTVYEFIQRKFEFSNEDEKLKYYNALYLVIPSSSSSTRTLLNGAIVEVFKLLKDSSFFILNDKISILLADIEDDIENDVIQKAIEYNCSNQ